MTAVELLSALGSNSDSGIGWHVDATLAVGAVLYFVLFIAICADFLWRLRTSSIVVKSLATVYFACLPLFLIIRVLWCVLEMKDNLDSATFFLNRLAFVVLLFVFNSILFYWADTVHTTVNGLFAKQAISGDLDFGYMSPAVKITFWVATVLMALFTLGTTVAGTVLYHGKPPESSGIYNANILMLAVTYLLYSGGFLFYGTRLFLRLRDRTSLSRSALWQVELFSVALCLCFLTRVVMFLIRIASGKRINNVAFQVLAYWVPEMLPCIFCMWAVSSKIVDDDSQARASLIAKPGARQSQVEGGHYVAPEIPSPQQH